MTERSTYRIVITAHPGERFGISLCEVATNSQGAEMATGVIGAPHAQGVGARAAREVIDDCVSWVFMQGDDEEVPTT